MCCCCSVWDVGDRQQHWLFQANQTGYKLSKKFGVGDGHMGVLCAEADGLELCDYYRFMLIQARFHLHVILFQNNQLSVAMWIKFKRHSHLLMKAWREEEPWSLCKNIYTRTWVHFPLIGALESQFLLICPCHFQTKISPQENCVWSYLRGKWSVRSAHCAQDSLGKLNLDVHQN